MSERGETVLRTWQSDYADTHLVQLPSGDRLIRKCYRSPFYLYFLRETLVMKRLSRLSVVPPLRRTGWLSLELEITWQAGPTVLEWILDRHGQDLAPDSENDGSASEATAEALQRFRESGDPADEKLRAAIRNAYADLHESRFMHGDPGPQNLIYEGERVYLVDFDHGRPSADPARLDNLQLAQLYGVTAPSRSLGALARLFLWIEDLLRS